MRDTSSKGKRTIREVRSNDRDECVENLNLDLNTDSDCKVGIYSVIVEIQGSICTGMSSHRMT